ncbi:MAG: hypothetical protein Q4G52_00830, partial [Clostridia bacterium]|nr:hypothetical protein [Clostridia bacterium]
VSVPAGETVSVRIPVCSLIPQQTFEVILRDAWGNELAKTGVTALRSIERSTVLVGVLDEDAQALADELEQRGRERMGKRSALRALALDGSSFPQSETELSAFDVLLLDRFDPAQMSEQQQNALASWAQKGGVALLGEGQAERSASAWFAQRKGLEAVRLEPGMQAAEAAVERLIDIQAQEDASNYRFYPSAAALQRVSRGVSIWPAGLLLAAYVVIVGFGLYAMMNRGDRRKALWAAIPACAVVGVAAMVGISCVMELNEPALSSVHVTVYDEDWKAYTEEHATLSYADQTRVTISAPSGEAIERLTSRYFSSYAGDGAPDEMRDVLTIGDAPAIELRDAAPWVTRELVIMSDHMPQGTVEGRAYMAEDGLHAEIANLTDVRLEDAVLITGVSFLSVGDIEPGEEREIVLARESYAFDDEGDVVIREGVLMPYTLEQTRFVNLCVYPETAEDPDFKAEQLGETEQYDRELRASLLRMVLNSGAAGTMPCSLIARTCVPCTSLTLNGDAIERMAQSSVLIKNIRFETRTEDGRFYEPLGRFEAWNAYQSEGEAPMLSSVLEQRYLESDQEILLGYDLEDIRPGDATEIRVVIQNRYGWPSDTLSLHVYDHANQKWTAIDTKTCSVISGDLVRRAVSEEGKFFLRVSDINSGIIDVPQIVVEGQIQPRAAQPEEEWPQDQTERIAETGGTDETAEQAEREGEEGDGL